MHSLQDTSEVKKLVATYLQLGKRSSQPFVVRLLTSREQRLLNVIELLYGLITSYLCLSLVLLLGLPLIRFKHIIILVDFLYSLVQGLLVGLWAFHVLIYMNKERHLVVEGLRSLILTLIGIGSEISFNHQFRSQIRLYITLISAYGLKHQLDGSTAHLRQLAKDGHHLNVQLVIKPATHALVGFVQHVKLL
jgi:hypothetical protein